MMLFKSRSLKVPAFSNDVDGEVQRQLVKLQEELRQEREEKAIAMEELEILKKKKEEKIKAQHDNHVERTPEEMKQRMESLEEELEEEKEAKEKLFHTIELQKTKLDEMSAALKDAKQEMESLHQNNTSLEALAALSSGSARRPPKHFRSQSMSIANTSEAEIRNMRNELKQAIAAEEKSKKALDDLAIALKEVTTEANQVKGRLWIAEAELKAARAEADRYRTSLENMEANLRAVLVEAGKTKLESEESAAVWAEKERGLVECIKVFGDELRRAQEENEKLKESQKAMSDDNSRMRGLLKQAVSEANIVKESLEIARRENSQLKDLLAEKERA